jgi:hypothetical protein
MGIGGSPICATGVATASGGNVVRSISESAGFVILEQDFLYRGRNRWILRESRAGARRNHNLNGTIGLEAVV